VDQFLRLEPIERDVDGTSRNRPMCAALDLRSDRGRIRVVAQVENGEQDERFEFSKRAHAPTL
jgi:hypothetical protein